MTRTNRFLTVLTCLVLISGCASKKPKTDIATAGGGIGPYSSTGSGVALGPDGRPLDLGGTGGSSGGSGGLVDSVVGSPGDGNVIVGPDGTLYDISETGGGRPLGQTLGGVDGIGGIGGIGGAGGVGVNGGGVAGPYGGGAAITGGVSGALPGGVGINAAGGHDFIGDDGSASYFSVRVGDRVFFGTDRYDLSIQSREVLQRQAAWLRLHQGAQLLIEGHTDERGTRSYNLGLGARRANSVRDYMVSLGIDPARLQTISYGKERPFESCSAARCWDQNRRAVSVVRNVPGA